MVLVYIFNQHFPYLKFEQIWTRKLFNCRKAEKNVIKFQQARLKQCNNIQNRKDNFLALFKMIEFVRKYLHMGFISLSRIS